MIRRLAALVALAAGFAVPTYAAACPERAPDLLFHSCWGGGHARLLLLPEELPIPGPPGAGLSITVTGSYTGKDTREEGRPKPVGLFIHDGQVVNRNLARMDGVLVIDPADGQPRLEHRNRVRLGDRTYDLTRLDERRAFIAEAAERKLSVLQSHLLIADGEIDVTEQDNAPAYQRRLLFVDAEGFGIYQTRWPVTLHEVASAVADAYHPSMALNLDMGSFDFCLRAEAGSETPCGTLGRADTGKLSNVIVVTGG